MKFFCGTTQYETTETFPDGYLVWNIGEDHAPAGYLPLCRLLPADRQSFEGGRAIDAEAILALPVSNEIRRVALRKAAKRDIDREEFEVIVKIVELSQKSKQKN